MPQRFFDSPGAEDSSGNVVSNTIQTQRHADSQYSFSPERLRLDVNGSRAFVQYNSISQFTDQGDSYLLSPGVGDVVGIETAESLTYKDGFDIDTSWTFGLTQQAQSGDVLKAGPFVSGEDGWFIEHRGSDHTNSQVDIIELRNGTRNVLAADVNLVQPLTDFFRYSCVWGTIANLGAQEWTQSFTDDGEQINNIFANTSNDTGRGPVSLNLPVRVEIEAANSGFSVEVGPMGHKVNGDPGNKIRRIKPQQISTTIPRNDNTWIPTYAVRIDPNNDNVNVQLSNFEAVSYKKEVPIEMLVISVDPSKTDASGFSEPEYQDDANSVIQDTTSVSTIPNDAGTVVTPTSTTDPGGITKAYSSRQKTDKSSTGAQFIGDQDVKQPIFDSDVLVFLARTPDADGLIRFFYSTIQDW